MTLKTAIGLLLCVLFASAAVGVPWFLFTREKQRRISDILAETCVRCGKTRPPEEHCPCGFDPAAVSAAQADIVEIIRLLLMAKDELGVGDQATELATLRQSRLLALDYVEAACKLDPKLRDQVHVDFHLEEYGRPFTGLELTGPIKQRRTARALDGLITTYRRRLL